MAKVSLYIGSNNDTLRIDEEYKNKALNILDKYLEGYSQIPNVQGRWRKTNEESFLVVHYTNSVNRENLKVLCEDLKKNLNQIAIGVEIDERINFEEF